MSGEDIKNSFMQLIEKINEPNYICLGTKESIDKVKEYLPENVEPYTTPDNYFLEDMQNNNNIYIIPCKEREVSIRW